MWRRDTLAWEDRLWYHSSRAHISDRKTCFQNQHLCKRRCIGCTWLHLLCPQQAQQESWATVATVASLLQIALQTLSKAASSLIQNVKPNPLLKGLGNPQSIPILPSSLYRGAVHQLQCFHPGAILFTCTDGSTVYHHILGGKKPSWNIVKTDHPPPAGKKTQVCWCLLWWTANCFKTYENAHTHTHTKKLAWHSMFSILKDISLLHEPGMLHIWLIKVISSRSVGSDSIQVHLAKEFKCCPPLTTDVTSIHHRAVQNFVRLELWNTSCVSVLSPWKVVTYDDIFVPAICLHWYTCLCVCVCVSKYGGRTSVYHYGLALLYPPSSCLKC